MYRTDSAFFCASRWICENEFIECLLIPDAVVVVSFNMSNSFFDLFHLLGRENPLLKLLTTWIERERESIHSSRIYSKYSRSQGRKRSQFSCYALLHHHCVQIQQRERERERDSWSPLFGWQHPVEEEKEERKVKGKAVWDQKEEKERLRRRYNYYTVLLEPIGTP